MGFTLNTNKLTFQFTLGAQYNRTQAAQHDRVSVRMRQEEEEEEKSGCLSWMRSNNGGGQVWLNKKFVHLKENATYTAIFTETRVRQIPSSHLPRIRQTATDTVETGYGRNKELGGHG